MAEEMRGGTLRLAITALVIFLLVVLIPTFVRATEPPRRSSRPGRNIYLSENRPDGFTSVGPTAVEPGALFSTGSPHGFTMTLQNASLLSYGNEGSLPAYGWVLPRFGGGRNPVSYPVGDAEDKNLIVRASRGDVEAFSQLVRNRSSFVYRVAQRIVGIDNAQDASQEVWVRVWRRIEDFRGESAFSTWLYKITVNACLDARRKEQRREERELPEEPPYLPETPTSDNDPEASALNQERRDEIFESLEYVREDHRAALVLRHMEGLSYQEIAEVMDVPKGTAKGWVSRGRASMLVALSEKRRRDSEGKNTGGET